MTLEFQPPFQIQPNAPTTTTQALGQLGDTFQNIGEQALRQRQYSIENQRQAALLRLQQAQGARQGQTQAYEYGNDAGAPYGGQPLDVRSGVQSSPLSQYPQAGGGMSQPSPMGSKPTSGVEQGVTGSFPQGQSQMNTPFPSPSQGNYPQYASAGTADNSSLSMPTQGRHPDGTPFYQPGQNQPQNPIAQAQNGASSYNPNDPYSLGVNKIGPNAIGSKAYQDMLENRQFGSRGRVLATMGKTIFPGSSAEDLANSGLTPEKVADLQASIENRKAMQSLMGQRVVNQEQQPAQVEAGKLYNDFVTTDTASTTAKQSLAQAQNNPAMFNTALFNVGKALGVTSRNPQMVIQAIAAGDPSLAGQLQEYVAKKGGGKLTPELLSGLNTMVDNLQQSNKQAFEQKAQSHIQQNSRYYKSPQEAAQTLFPRYQFGGQGGGNGGGGGGQPIKIGRFTVTVQ